MYRRYRPETFADVIGQEHVTEPLMQALRTGRVNHAYLFSGPRGCGKTTSARILARCLNCEQGPTPTPCGVCESCVALSRGGSGTVDVIEIDAASHGGVDDARDLRERASYGPAQARYKIYIIDEAHMVTPQGFNALLKIVEEPPEHVKFVFATTEPEKVIGTIRSRTHHYPFRLVPPARLTDYLQQLCDAEGVAVEPGVLSFVTRAGAGSVRDSLSVLDQLIAGSGEEGLTYAGAAALLGFTDGELLDATVDALGARDSGAVFRQIDRVVESGHDPRRFIEDLLERLRDLIVIAAVPDGAAQVLRGVPEDQLDRMRQQAASFGPGELSRAADIVNTGLSEMTGATGPRLQLELICARVLLPAVSGEQGYAARLDRLERRMDIGGPPAMGGGRVSGEERAGHPSGGRVSGEDQAGHPSGGRVSGEVRAAHRGPAGLDTGSASASPYSTSAGAGSASASPYSTSAGAGSASASPRVGQEQSSGGRVSGEERAAHRGPAGLDTGSASASPYSTSAGAGSAGASPRVGQEQGSGGRVSGEERAAHRGPAGLDTGSASASPYSTSAGAGSAGASPRVGQEQGSGGRVSGEERAAHRGPAGLDTGSASASPYSTSAGAGSTGAGAGSTSAGAASAGAGAPQQAAPSGAVTTDAVRRAWPDVLERIARAKRVTWTLLSQHAHVADFDGETLVLGTSSPGLAQAVERPPHPDVVAAALFDALGIRARVTARPDSGAPAPNLPPEPDDGPGRAPGPPDDASAPAAPQTDRQPPAQDIPPPVDGPSDRTRDAAPPSRRSRAAEALAQAGLSAGSGTTDTGGGWGSVNAPPPEWATAENPAAPDRSVAQAKPKPEEEIAESMDDEDVDDPGPVGLPVMQAVLGATVIDEQVD
nr:DNA polymerase III subunit gamma and tau [Flexivirga oryzae]